jgi:signal transduction histidine kinase
LLVPEISTFLRERDVQVRVSLCDHLSRPLDAATLSSLQRVLKEHERCRNWERRMVELGPIGAAVSHEVRNVVGGVVGLAQVSLTRPRSELALADLPPDTTEALQLIVRESQRALEILSGYLEYANPRTLTAQLVSAEALIDPVVQMVTFQAKQKGCVLLTDIAQGLPDVMLRASEVREVLLNLLINSIYASKRDGRIEVVAERAGLEMLQIRIRDEGPGVPDDLKEKIFEAYFSTKPAGEGTGLGLALASRVIQEHGGKLSVRDRHGGGAEFVVELPLKQSADFLSEGAPNK